MYTVGWPSIQLSSYQADTEYLHLISDTVYFREKALSGAQLPSILLEKMWDDKRLRGTGDIGRDVSLSLDTNH